MHSLKIHQKKVFLKKIISLTTASKSPVKIPQMYTFNHLIPYGYTSQKTDRANLYFLGVQTLHHTIFSL